MIKTVMLDFNSSYRRSLKEYYHEVGTDFNSIKNEVNKRYSSLHIDFKKFSENYNKCQNETMKMWDFKIKCETELKNIQTDFQKFGNETLLKMDKIRKVDVNENECNKGKLHQRFQNSELYVLDTTSIVNIISKFFMLFLYNETSYGIKSFKKIYDNNQRKGLTEFTCCS